MESEICSDSIKYPSAGMISFGANITSLYIFVAHFLFLVYATLIICLLLKHLWSKAKNFVFIQLTTIEIINCQHATQKA